MDSHSTPAKKWYRSKPAAIGAGVFLIGAAIAGGSIYSYHELSRPYYVAARETAALYESVHRLAELVSPTNSGKITGSQAYLQATADIQLHCRRIPKEITAGSLPADIGKAFTAQYQNALNTCKDLDELAGQYQMLYSPVLPIQDISTKVKLYQTLPLIRQKTISGHQNIIRHAADERSSGSITGLDFTSGVLQTLPQLDKTVKNAKKIDYLSSISRFQLSLQGEQTLFWRSTFGIADLEDFLAAQTDRFCTLVPDAGIPKGTCERANHAKD